MSEVVSGKAFHKVFSGSPLISGNKRNTDQWASTKHPMEGFSRHNSSLISRKYQAKFENYCISRSGHWIKITPPNVMILVSFSSADNALSNDVENNFSSQALLKIRRSAYWDTRYMVTALTYWKLEAVPLNVLIGTCVKGIIWHTCKHPWSEFLLQVASDFIRILWKIYNSKLSSLEMRNKKYPDFLLMSLFAKSVRTDAFRRKS